MLGPAFEVPNQSNGRGNTEQGCFSFFFFFSAPLPCCFVLLELSQIQTHCRCSYCSQKMLGRQVAPVPTWTLALQNWSTWLIYRGWLLARYGYYSPPVLLKLMEDCFWKNLWHSSASIKKQRARNSTCSGLVNLRDPRPLSESSHVLFHSWRNLANTCCCVAVTGDINRDCWMSECHIWKEGRNENKIWKWFRGIHFFFSRRRKNKVISGSFGLCFFLVHVNKSHGTENWLPYTLFLSPFLSLSVSLSLPAARGDIL